MLDDWLYWLKHAQTYEPERRYCRRFRSRQSRRASETLIRITQITEDKAMYDARERAIRDRKWELDAAKREGKVEGKIELIHTLQGLLYQPLTGEKGARGNEFEQLETLKSSLRTIAEPHARINRKPRTFLMSCLNSIACGFV